MSRRGQYEIGRAASELWGVARSDRKPTGKERRSDAARARRRAKKKAKAMGITLKAWLRHYGSKE